VPAWNYLFDMLNDSSTKRKPRPRVIMLDEIYHIGYGTGFPKKLPVGITTARQKKLSYFINSQRPKNIPAPILSEASRIFIFYLNKEDDMKYMAGFAREDKKAFLEDLKAQKKDFSFIELDATTGTYQRRSPVKITQIEGD